VVFDYTITHMRTMVLVYLPTKLGDFVRANVGKYTIHGAYGFWRTIISLWITIEFLSNYG